MKKKLTAILPLIIIVVVVLSMMYTRPVALDKLIEGLDWTQCGHASVSYAIHMGEGADTPTHTVTAQPGDPLLDELISLVEGREFARSFYSLFSGNQVEAPTPMAGEISLLLTYEVGGRTITFRTLGEGEELLLSNGESTWQGAFPNMPQWLTDTIALVERDVAAQP